MKRPLVFLTLTSFLTLGWAATAQQSNTQQNNQPGGQGANRTEVSCLLATGKAQQGSQAGGNNQTAASSNIDNTGQDAPKGPIPPVTAPAGTGGAGAGNAGNGTAAAPGTTGSMGPGVTGTGTTGTGTTGTGAGGAARNDGQIGNLSTAEICFLDKAARSNLFEIRSSELASRTSTNNAVKSLAQRLIRDHTQANQRLETLVGRLNARLPTSPDTEQLALIESLRAMKGNVFDATYLAQQIAAHNEAIRLFEQYSREASDQNVRQFASQTLPLLKEHLRMAQQAQRSLTSSGR